MEDMVSYFKTVCVVVLSFLVVSCHKVRVVEHVTDSWIVADFESTFLPISFSDTVGLESSGEVIKLKSVKGVIGSGLRVEYDIEHYAGFTIDMPVTDLTKYHSISFYIRKVSGNIPTIQLHTRSIDNERKHATLNFYLIDLGNEWDYVQIPISRFGPFEKEMLENVHEISFVLHVASGVVDVDQVTVHQTDPVGESGVRRRLPYPLRSSFDLPKGAGAWCYGDPDFAITYVKKFNEASANNEKIRYLYAWAGSIEFTTEGKTTLVWKPEHALRLASELAGEVFVLPMINGISLNSNAVSEQQWIMLAEQIGMLIENQPLFYGVHFDIEPHEDILYYLFSYVKRYTAKPITAALDRWNIDAFRYTDMAVLMGYDWAANPYSFAQIASKRIPRFLADASEGGGMGQIGVPAIATHLEFESIKHTAYSKRELTGYTMANYLDGSLQAINLVMPEFADAFVGLSIWAIHSHDGLHSPKDSNWYYPTRISDEISEMMRSPIGPQTLTLPSKSKVAPSATGTSNADFPSSLPR